MALVVKDRVKETTATTGTGTLTLAGAVTGFQPFSSALSDGDTTYYAIFESSTGEWEVGLGTFTASGTTLARTTVLASSNAGSAVNLTAGSAEVFITQPATKAAYFDGSGDLNLTRDPQSALQAATKQYVDTIAAAGLHYHSPVRVQTTANLTATYNNGSSGVGATLTNSGTQAAISIDNVTLSSADRVLVSEQTNAAHNGVYTVTNVGSASTNWVLTRATDADSYGPSDPNALGEGDAFFIKEGDTNAGHLDVMTTSGTITFGTTDIVFSEVAETTVYSAGNGLTLTGTTFAVGAGTGVTVNANDVAIGQSVGTGDTVTFATVNANLTGDVTGNADTATALETARTIGGVSFDGTANINLPGVNTAGNQNTSGNAATATALATGRTISLTGDVTGTSGSFDGSGNVSIAATIAANSVALGTDTTGNYVADITAGNLIDVSGGGSETATVTVNVDLSELTTSTSDGDGDFFVVVDSVNAQKKLTKGNINISGFNNDAGYTTNVGDITGVTAGTYITGGGTSGTVTVNVDATSANTASKVVARDASGNFSAGTITAALDGNASTATSATNADTVDSLHASSFLRSDTADTATGLITIDRTGEALGIGDGSLDTADAYIRIGNGSLDWQLKYVGSTSGTGGNEFRIESSNTGDYLQFDHDGNFQRYDGTSTYTIWDSGNDGSGSGLDADLLDGKNASASESTSTIVARSVSGYIYTNYYNGTGTFSTTGNTSGMARFTGTNGNDTFGRSYTPDAAKTALGLNSTDSPTFGGMTLNGPLDMNNNVIYDVEDIGLQDRLYHEGDTNTYLEFEPDEIRLTAGGSQEVTINTTGVRLGDTGNGYFQPVSGNYGSIQIDGGAHGTYEGYSIGGVAVWMTNSTSYAGLFNDANNQWWLRGTFNGSAELYYAGTSKFNTSSTGANINGDLNAVDNIYVASNIYHEGDTDTSIGMETNAIRLKTGGADFYFDGQGLFITSGSLAEVYNGLSGTTPTCNVDNAGAFSLTMTGNTTFTFSGPNSGYSQGFVLELTGNATTAYTVTWPTSVEWAGGTAPDAPAVGETDIYVFWTRDGGTNWYGILSIDAAA